MLRVRVCAAHVGEFFGPKFSKQGSLFRQIFHKRGWVVQKLAKNSQKWVVFRQNHHKNGYDRKIRWLEEGTFLKTGQQIPIHPQVMYLPPGSYDLLLRGLVAAKEQTIVIFSTLTIGK